MKLDAQYWNQRYLDDNTPWDAGAITTPLKDYIDQLGDLSIKILIPGAGNAHEATYLHQKGFTNVHICDWAQATLDTFSAKLPTFPKSHLHQANFFELTGQYDLILEQTFFCAIDPKLRLEYVKKTAALLHSKGRIAGLLFAQQFSKPGPPFGGIESEYRQLFSSHYEIHQLHPSLNSIKPRANSELFFEFYKL